MVHGKLTSRQGVRGALCPIRRADARRECASVLAYAEALLLSALQLGSGALYGDA